MKIEFIIPAFNRINPLFSMIASLMAQNNPNWTANVVIDDCKKNDTEGVVKMFNDTRVYYTYLDKRYNDWGHTPREIGKQDSDANYVIMTGDDNYYMPILVQEIIDEAKKNNNPGLIYWNMVHSHFDYSSFNCQLFISHIDMGAFATRTDIAKKIKLETTFAADGLFVGKFNELFSNEKSVKINKILYVHN